MASRKLFISKPAEMRVFFRRQKLQFRTHFVHLNWS